MSSDEFRDGLRQNVVWLVAIVVILGFGVIGWMMQKDATPGPDSGVASDSAVQNSSPTTSTPVERSARQTPQEKALATIADHQARVDENPTSPETPALLFAMGNMYRQKLMNYEEAARCYSIILTDHPNWEAKSQVYIQLATCYERLGRLDDRNWVLEEILKNLPSDSQEYLYAQVELGQISREDAIGTRPSGGDSTPPPDFIPGDEAPAETVSGNEGPAEISPAPTPEAL